MSFIQKDSSWSYLLELLKDGRNTKLENLTTNGNVKYNQTWEI